MKAVHGNRWRSFKDSRELLQLHWLRGLLPANISIDASPRDDNLAEILSEDHALRKTEKDWSQLPWRETLDRLDSPEFAVDSSLYAALLRQCGDAGALSDGKRVYAHIVKEGHLRNRYLRNLLVRMYAKCGALEDACELFAKMHQRDVFSWTFMIGAYAQCGQAEEALRLFQQMQLEGELPNKHTFVSILSACAKQTISADGKAMHAIILQDALKLFDRMPDRNPVSWNAMIGAYSQHGYAEKSLQFFQQMQQEALIPSRVTFLKILDACAKQADIVEGKRIHSLTVGTEFASDVFGNSLVSMYCQWVSVENALRVFDRMPERSIVSWNALIGVYGQHKHNKEFLQFFRQMQQEGVIMNKFTFVTFFAACASNEALADGREMHARCVGCALESDVVVGTALINMYSDFGKLGQAQMVFDTMHDLNVVAWNAIIAACAQHGQGKRSLQHYLEMQQQGFKPDRITFVCILDICAGEIALVEGQQFHFQTIVSGLEPDVAVQTALLNMYGRCGNLDDAQKVFDTMPKRNIVSWTAMIAAYAQHGRGNAALQIFQNMKSRGVIPDKVAIISVLDACASQAAVAIGKQMHSCIVGCAFEWDVVIGNGLVNMYGKCGSLEDARRVFDKLPERNVISWTSIIAAHGQQGEGKEAVRLFLAMQWQGIIPDEVAVISFLSACSHAGLLDEGSSCFLNLNQDRSIAASLDHYNCVIDLLGRAGRLGEGEDLMNRMPFQPTSASWMTFLGACRMHTDVERGEHAAENVLALEPANATSYLLLSNIYAAAGRWADVSKLNRLIRDNGLCSVAQLK